MHEESRSRRKAVWGRAAWLMIGAVALVSVPACGPVSDMGRSPSYVIIEALQGASGAAPDKLAFVVQSDVQTFGSPFEDPGQVTVRLGLRDPGSKTSANSPTSTNFITLTHYKVVYTRTDGRNTPGVDVPYPIEGGMTVTVTGDSTTANFVLVRAQAKLDPPLRALIGLGGAVVIATTAEVTFYGTDQVGTPVSVTGYITVTFADWGDPSS
jgi:hypothetical protein